MSEELTYLLSPKLYFQRDGLIALGSIVADPFQPHYALTAVDESILAEKYPNIKSYTDFDTSLTDNRNKNASMFSWLKFLETANKNTSLVGEKYRLDQCTMTFLETEHFASFPSKQEIESRINVARVREFIKAGKALGAPQPLYMVTGRKLARGIHAVQSNVEQAVASQEVNENDLRDTLVFAYQLIRINVSGQSESKVEHHRSRREGGFLDMNDDDEVEEDEDVEMAVDISAVTVVDFEMMATEEDMMLMEEVGEGDEKLWLISLQDKRAD